MRTTTALRLAGRSLLAILAVAASMVVMPSEDVFGQAYCTTPGPPPVPPPPPPPPPPCRPTGDRCDRCTGSPCFVASGVYVTQETDLSINTASFPLTVSRSYESNRFVDGPIGVGWMSSLTPRLYYATYLFAAPSTYNYDAVVLMPDGAAYTFRQEANGSFTPPFGRKDVLVRNGDGTFDLTLEFTRVVMRFNADGSMARITNEFGSSMSYSYVNGRLSSIQDDMGSGRSLSITWGASGRISTVTDHTGRVIRYDYGTDGTLTSVTNPLNQVTTFTYTSGRFAPLLTSIRDHWNRVVTELEWFADEKLESYTEGLYTGAGSAGEKYTYAYYPQSNYATQTHSLGVKSYTYSPYSWLINPPGGVLDQGTGDPITRSVGGMSLSYYYDPQGRLTHILQGGIYWKYEYEPSFPDRVASIRPLYSNGVTPHPDWAGVYMVYAQSNETAPGSLKEIQMLRSDGTTRDWVHKMTYDARGRVLSHTNVHDGYTTTYVYGTGGEIVSATTPTGTTTIEYDSLGRMTKVTNEMGQETTYTYDVLDRLLTETLPKPSVGSPLNFTTTYTHDQYDSASGLLFTHTTDPNGRVTKTGFDALGNMARQIDEANNATTYTYQYNLLDRITDPNGNVTRFIYNSNRQHTQTVFPDGGTETYNTNGNTVLSRVDRRGITTAYGYDGFGRMTSMTATQNNLTIESASYSYTGQKLMSMSYTKGGVADTISYTYDSAFRVLTETQGTRGKLTYTYAPTGAADRPMTYASGPVSGPTTASATYSYDSKGRLQYINWSRSGTFLITYNALDQQTQIIYPSGHKRTFAYDGQGRLTTMANIDHYGGNMATFAYGYDHDWATNTDTMLGMLTHVDVTADLNLYQNNGRTKYTYDTRYQMTRVDYPSGWEAWTYDAIGNRTSRQTQAGTTNYAYYLNAGSQNSLRLKNSGSGGDYAYDGNGNLLGRVGVTPQYVWDAQNRLTSFDNATAQYDAHGRRVKRTYATSLETTYLYSGMHVVGEKLPYYNIDNVYLFGSTIDQPLAVSTASGEVHYYLADGQGSIIGRTSQATDDESEVVKYSVWGEPSATAYNGYPFGFTGREKTDTPFWYYRARHYDPRLGRFVSEDPISQFMHITGAEYYAYTANAPANYTDPTGLEPCNWRIEHGIWMRNGYSMGQEWEMTFSRTQQVVNMIPPPINLLTGRGIPIWVSFHMTCGWKRLLVITDHYKRRIRVTLTCDCPRTRSVWFDEQERHETWRRITGGAVTRSSWPMGAPVRICRPPS